MLNAKQQRLLQDWVAALRSGEYKQGREALMRGDKYCCLGVLACVANVPHRKLSRASSTHEFQFKKDHLPEDCTVPLDWFEEMTGLQSHLTANLIGMNDTEQASFKRIANHIEKWATKEYNHVKR
jgi:hypothetical protein